MGRIDFPSTIITLSSNRVLHLPQTHCGDKAYAYHNSPQLKRKATNDHFKAKLSFPATFYRPLMVRKAKKMAGKIPAISDSCDVSPAISREPLP
jgi:hypothetical protein